MADETSPPVDAPTPAANEGPSAAAAAKPSVAEAAIAEAAVAAPAVAAPAIAEAAIAEAAVAAPAVAAPAVAAPVVAAPAPAPDLELPAAVKDLRPAPRPPSDSTVTFEPVGNPLSPRPQAPIERASDAMSDATAEALAHVRREGAWRTVLRVVGVVATLALCLRLAFDDALPRLLLGGGVALLAALAVARVAHAWSQVRRRKAMLKALELLTRVGSGSPESLQLLAPQIASLIAALRAEDPRFSEVSPDEVILRALSPAGNSSEDVQRSG